VAWRIALKVKIGGVSGELDDGRERGQGKDGKGRD